LRWLIRDVEIWKENQQTTELVFRQIKQWQMKK
jgi:hypothetical protein